MNCLQWEVVFLLQEQYSTWPLGRKATIVEHLICRSRHIISGNEWSFLFVFTDTVFLVSAGLWRRGVWRRSFPSGCQLPGPISFCSANEKVVFAASWCRVPLPGFQTEIMPAVFCEKTLSLHRQLHYFSRAAGKTWCWTSRIVHVGNVRWFSIASFPRSWVI